MLPSLRLKKVAPPVWTRGRLSWSLGLSARDSPVPDSTRGSTTVTAPWPRYRAGVYQIGELQARSWIVGGTTVDSGRLLRAASYVDHRGVGISITLR